MATDLARLAIAIDTGDLKKAQNELKKLENQGKRTEKTAKDMKSSFGLFNTSTLVLATSLYSLASAIISVVKASMEMESMEMALNAAVGGADKASQAIEFLKKTTDDLGLSLVTSVSGFSQFAAAAKQSALEGQGVRDIFLGVAKASTVMGLSADNQDGVFRALTQMMSKGKVQAEELRGQLGERLPGAFQIAARAMNMTTKELDKFMADGKLISDEFLPKFANQLEKEFGGKATEAAKTARAEQARYNNSLLEMKVAIGESGLDDLTKDFYKLAASMAQITTTNIPELIEAAKHIAIIGVSVASATLAISGYNAVSRILGAIALENSVKIGKYGQALATTTISTRAAKVASHGLSLAMKSIPLIAVTAGLVTVSEMLLTSSRNAKTLDDAISSSGESLSKLTMKQLEYTKAVTQSALVQKSLEYAQARADVGSDGIFESDKEKLADIEKKNRLRKEFNDLRKLSLDINKSIINFGKEEVNIIKNKNNSTSITNELTEKQIKAKEKQIELNLKLREALFGVTGSQEDVFFMNLSNEMSELAKSTDLTNKELQKFYDVKMQLRGTELEEQQKEKQREINSEKLKQIELDFQLKAQQAQLLQGDDKAIALAQLTLDKQREVLAIKYQMGEISKQYYDTAIANEEMLTAQIIKSYDEFGKVMTSVGQSMETSFMSFFDATSEGFGDLKALGLDVAQEIYKALLKNYIIGQAASSTSAGSGIVGGITSMFFADGGVVSSPSLSNYSNSVVDSPTPFYFASGGVPSLGVAGEVPGKSEAIMPLTRTSGGDLGVKMVGEGNSAPQNISVSITNESGQQLEVTDSSAKFDMEGTVMSIVLNSVATNKYGARKAIGNG